MVKAEPVPEHGVCLWVPQSQCLPCAAWGGLERCGEVRQAGSRWTAACAAASTAF